MAALTVIATPRRHTNVLQHMAGYFKDQLDAASKAELPPRSTTIAAGSCRSSCRSRCCVTTSGSTT